MSGWQIIEADVRAGLAQLPDSSVQTGCTSPPYCRVEHLVPDQTQQVRLAL